MEIYCGADYSVQQKLEQIRDNNIVLAFKLKKVEEFLKKGSAGSEELLKIREKMKQAIQCLNANANTLIFKLDNNEAAEVVVKGIIYPGTYIEICHISYTVSRKMNGLRFKLDKAKGIIVTESLGNKRSVQNGV